MSYSERNNGGVHVRRVAVAVAMSALFALTGCADSETESAPTTTEDPKFLGMWVRIGDDCKLGEYGADMRMDLGETLLYCERGELTDGSAAAARDREDRELRAAARRVIVDRVTCEAREVSGMVMNNSDRRVDVTLQITLTDANDVRIDDFLLSVPRVQAGTTAQFSRPVSHEYRKCGVRIDSVR